MAWLNQIVAVRGIWDVTIFVKNNSIVERTEQLRINQDATVRKLFKQVRTKLKATTAIRLFRITQSGSETEITKSDDTIGSCNVGITNGTRLRVQIHPSNPEVFTIFVTMPNDINKTFLLEEKENTTKLYQVVRQQLNAGQKVFKLKFGENIISENTDTLYAAIFDGIQLKVSINPNKWSLNIMYPQRSAIINVPEDATVLDLFREVGSRLPANADLRLSIANTELRKEVHGQHLLSKYAQHTSHVVVIWRNKGGGDDYPQLQMLYDEGWFRCDYHHGYYL